MQYKVGDKILIKSYKQLQKLSKEETVSGLSFSYDRFVVEMKPYCNKIVTIKKILKFEKPGKLYPKIRYQIKEDFGFYLWYADWFAPATKIEKILFGE